MSALAFWKNAPSLSANRCEKRSSRPETWAKFLPNNNFIHILRHRCSIFRTNSSYISRKMSKQRRQSALGRSLWNKIYGSFFFAFVEQNNDSVFVNIYGLRAISMIEFHILFEARKKNSFSNFYFYCSILFYFCTLIKVMKAIRLE